MFAGILKPIEGPLIPSTVFLLLLGGYLIWLLLKYVFRETRRHPFPYNRPLVWTWRAIGRWIRSETNINQAEED